MLLLPPNTTLGSLALIEEKRKKTPGATSFTSLNCIFGSGSPPCRGTAPRESSRRVQATRVYRVCIVRILGRGLAGCSVGTTVSEAFGRDKGRGHLAHADATDSLRSPEATVQSPSGLPACFLMLIPA